MAATSRSRQRRQTRQKEAAQEEGQAQDLPRAQDQAPASDQGSTTKEAPFTPQAGLDLLTFRQQMSKVLDQAAAGQIFTITRRGKPLAQVGPVQMSHQATDPMHRPVPEALQVTAKSPSWAERNAGQAGRDRLLGVFNKK